MLGNIGVVKGKTVVGFPIPYISIICLPNRHLSFLIIPAFKSIAILDILMLLLGVWQWRRFVFIVV